VNKKVSLYIWFWGAAGVFSLIESCYVNSSLVNDQGSAFLRAHHLLPFCFGALVMATVFCYRASQMHREFESACAIFFVLLSFSLFDLPSTWNSLFLGFTGIAAFVVGSLMNKTR
jgi:hypothetical protein